MKPHIVDRFTYCCRVEKSLWRAGLVKIKNIVSCIYVCVYVNVEEKISETLLDLLMSILMNHSYVAKFLKIKYIHNQYP